MSTSDFTKYQVDLVICLDVTASMGDILENVKRSALEMQARLERAANVARKSISDLRLQVIPFRDLEWEGSEAIWSSPWYDLPAQSEKLKEFLDTLKAKGGGSAPESALEALWTAMNSSWRERGERRRSIIVMMTDASAHELGRDEYELEQSLFPTPKNLDELNMRWGRYGDEEESVFGAVNINNRRLVLLAPDLSPWNDIGDKWERTVWLPSMAGAGLSELDWDAIARLIVTTV